jgi:hypothetical protein
MNAPVLFARATAIAIAIAAVIDPRLSLPRSIRPPVRVVGDAPEVARVSAALRSAGFASDPSQPEAATVLVTDRVPPRSLPAGRTWILDSSPRPPNAAIADVAANATRLPGQSLEVRVIVAGDGLAGKTSELVLEDSGIPVASVRHQWQRDGERWGAAMQYLPPSLAAGRLRVRVGAMPGETTDADNAADVAVPAVRGAVRTLVIEAAVTWPALFVRRALEGEGAFSVSSLQRAAKAVVTRGGAPPAAMTRSALAPYEVALVGGPEQLSSADLDALRWFVEERGGVLVLVPDQQPSGRYASVFGLPSFESRVVESPQRLGPDLRAAELAIPRGLSPAAMVLAADEAGDPIVVAVRRGAGAAIFSGALDAWRYRGQDEEAFARFWRRTVASQAVAVPPALDVTVEPALARPGERVTITARLRDDQLAVGADRLEIAGVAARAVGPAARSDEAIRLWPTAEPGLFTGEWRAPSAGAFDITASAGALRGDATITVAADVLHPSPADSSRLALLARASGGELFPAARLADLTSALASAYPPQRAARASHPMRSAWWCVPFAALLCVEWAVRRRRGLP